MDVKEFEGKNEEEAINKAIEALGLDAKNGAKRKLASLLPVRCTARCAISWALASDGGVHPLTHLSHASQMG